MALLEVDDLHVRFDTPEGEIHAVRGLDFDVQPGDALAIVGESGCGKTQTVLAILGLLAENGSVEGSATFRGDDLLRLPKAALNRHRGRDIAMIFQDPMSALNPYLTIERQMTEVLMHHQDVRYGEARDHAVEMLRAVRITDPEDRMGQYPHEFSGGMRQRVMIAMGLLCEPDILIADEPTTALDVTVQAQIGMLMAELREASKTALILITHDLGVVAGSCDRVLVMYAGEMVEYGTVWQIFEDPLHPYTRGLLASVPRLDQAGVDDLQGIPGQPPNLLSLPGGCAFRDRCPEARDACRRTPPVQRREDGRLVRCVIDFEREDRDG